MKEKMISKAQQEVLKRYEVEKTKGLKDINFFTGDLTQATVDSFCEELLKIDGAIQDGKYSSFMENF